MFEKVQVFEQPESDSLPYFIIFPGKAMKKMTFINLYYFKPLMRKHNRAEGAWSEWDKRPGFEPHRVPHAEADAGCLFCAGSLGAGSWHISGGTVSPGIYPGAAGAFCILPCVYLPRNDWNIWGRCGFAASHHTLHRNQSILDLEGTGSLAGDYSVFWGYANALAERTTVYGGRYMALFPHIFGYADFLSWFIRLSGPQPMLAPVLNGPFDGLLRSFLYHLCLRWFHLPRYAGLSALTLCPSQTI